MLSVWLFDKHISNIHSRLSSILPSPTLEGNAKMLNPHQLITKSEFLLFGPRQAVYIRTETNKNIFKNVNLWAVKPELDDISLWVHLYK